MRARLIADGLLAFARAGARPEPGAEADVAEVIAGAFKEIAAEATERGIAARLGGRGAGRGRLQRGRPGQPGLEPAAQRGQVCGPASLRRASSSAPRRSRSTGVRACGIEVEDNGPGLPAEPGRAGVRALRARAEQRSAGHRPRAGHGQANRRRARRRGGGPFRARGRAARSASSCRPRADAADDAAPRRSRAVGHAAGESHVLDSVALLPHADRPSRSPRRRTRPRSASGRSAGTRRGRRSRFW